MAVAGSGKYSEILRFAPTLRYNSDPGSSFLMFSKEMIAMDFHSFRHRVLVAIILWLSLICFPIDSFAKSWEVVMISDGEKVVWWLDEELGAKVSVPQMPNVEMIVRFDLQKNIWLHRRKRIHAVQDWGTGEGARMNWQLSPEQQAQIDAAKQNIQQQLQDAPPEAQAYAEQFLKGKLDAIPGQNAQPVRKEYRNTEKTMDVNGQKTWGVEEMVEGQPTGRIFWVAKVDDWESIARVLETATNQMDTALSPARQEDRIPFTELGGLPLRIDEPDRAFSEVVSIKQGKLTKAQMSPGRKSRETALMQFMMQLQPPKPSRR